MRQFHEHADVLYTTSLRNIWLPNGRRLSPPPELERKDWPAVVLAVFAGGYLPAHPHGCGAALTFCGFHCQPGLLPVGVDLPGAGRLGRLLQHLRYHCLLRG